MRIGMMFDPNPALSSLKYVANSLVEAAVLACHEPVFLPPEYWYASDEQARRICDDFVRSCDVLAGPPAERFLAARERTGSNIPVVSFMLGALSRGAPRFPAKIRYLTTRDVLVVNCTAEVELADKFFHNARVRMLPFAFDESVFHPLGEEERSAVREKLGFQARDRIVLYSGRVALEKNVHTLLRIFGAVHALVPDARLIIAGPAQDRPFRELGIRPVSLAGTVKKLVAGLGIPRDRVHLLGATAPGHLRQLYSIADVKANMTLHHDENFGMAQVEAMACGTPVVGTAWGGLRDTIADGTSGYRVSTTVTQLGVKLDWWEAVNRIVSLLRDPAAREGFRETGVRHAAEHYSRERFRSTLLEILAAASGNRDLPSEPLRATAFAEELWSVCGRQMRENAPYRRGERSYELYRELIGPFTGRTAAHVPADEAPDPRHVLSLASPVAAEEDGGFRVHDPMYPFEVDVPREYREAFEAILAAFREEPAMTAERLGRILPGDLPDAPDALAWMLATGLLLRTRPVPGWVAPERIDRRMGEPFFRIERFDRAGKDFMLF